MISAIAVVLVLGGLIFFHELGHFLVARVFKIGVSTFSLGFGPVLFGFKRENTRYVLSAVPLGGYVQLVAQDAGETPPEEFGREAWFCLRPAWQRMLVVAAGPMFNFLLAWFIYWGLAFAMGDFQPLPVVESATEGSAAMEAGILPGDRIVEANGRKIVHWDELVNIVLENGTKPLHLVLERDGARIETTAAPKATSIKNAFGEEEIRPLLGVKVDVGQYEVTPLGFGEAAVQGLRETWERTGMILHGIVLLIKQVVPLKELGGPILIAQAVGESASRGLAQVLSMAAFISINLGILNLLPIPVLDGGHILFFGMEAMMRRPLNNRVRQVTTSFGLAFLLMLMAMAVYNDLRRLFV